MNQDFVPSRSRFLWAAGCLVVLVAGLVAADSAAPVPPSAYAPAKDVVAQIEMFLGQLASDLAAEADYGEDQQGRVAKDANTLTVLAQVLARHDQDHPRKKSAAALFRDSQALAECAGKFSSAKSAWEKLAAGWKETAGAEGTVSKAATANLQELMKQVPIINNRLRAGVTGRRFDRTIEQNAGLAATLAVIAEASAVDADYCSGKEEEAQWAKICFEMRDAAAAVANAVRRKDQKEATAGLARLVKTCDDCHHDFRD